MSNLRSALHEIGATPNRDLTDSQLHADIDELLNGKQELEILLAGKVAEMERRRSHVNAGHPSPTAFLAHHGRMSAGNARRVVADGRAKAKAPIAYTAWTDGRVSTDQARQLFRLAESVPDEFPQAECLLVEIIEPLSVSETNRALEYWRQTVDGPGEISAEQRQIRRGFSMSKTLNGMRRVDGWLTTPAGEALEVAIDGLLPPPTEEDQRTPRQRRHDALEDLARSYLDHADTPVTGGEKPHVMVLTDLDALLGIAGGTHETVRGQVVDVDTIRQLACDASVSRIVLGPDSEILDAGRKTRVWSPAQRRAIVARDRHCTAPGCERPPQWCDIHHEDHWADGGITSVDKGRLYCRFHHTREHIKEARRRRRRT